MTRQDAERLARRFNEGDGGGVRHVRTVFDPQAGRMVCEWEAPDSRRLLDHLARFHVKLRSDSEWMMLVRVEI